MRVCPSCRVALPPEDFYSSRTNITECRPCFRARVAERKRLCRQYLLTYLMDHPCVDCGEADPVVLEFDHVRGTKSDGLSNLVVAANMARLVAEIAKCEVRCANCHRRKTALAQGWYAGLVTHT